jgi:gas vesicle protein
MAQDNTGSLIWFFAGAAVGASIALLYAPQSGRETRRIIVKKTKQGREALADTADDLMEKGRDLYEKGRQVADDAADLFERGRRLVEKG